MAYQLPVGSPKLDPTVGDTTTQIPPVNHQDDNHTARIQQARRPAKKELNLMDNAVEDEAGIQLDLMTGIHNGTIFFKLRCKPVATGAKGVYAKRVTFLREWFQPIAWTLQQFGWSRMSHPDDSPVEQRRCNISFLELTCAIDLLTGGAVGPIGAPFLAKVALVKY